MKKIYFCFDVELNLAFMETDFLMLKANHFSTLSGVFQFLKLLPENINTKNFKFWKLGRKIDHPVFYWQLPKKLYDHSQGRASFHEEERILYYEIGYIIIVYYLGGEVLVPLIFVIEIKNIEKTDLSKRPWPSRMLIKRKFHNSDITILRQKWWIKSSAAVIYFIVIIIGVQSVMIFDIP